MDFPIEPKRVDRTVPSDSALFKYPWIPYPAGTQILKEMAALMKRPHEGRPQNLALIGDPNFGKSHLLDFFIDHYPDLPEEEVPRVQILAVELPFRADGPMLIREMLRVTGGPVNARNPPDVLLDKLCVRCASLRVHLFLIDEFHNASWGRRDAAMSLLQAVKSISNRLRRPIVIAGTSAVNDVLRNDVQLSERFRRVRLPKWDDLGELKSLLTTFGERMDLPRKSLLGTTEMAQKVFELAGPKLGRIAVLVREAGRIAKEAGAEAVELKHLEQAASFLPGTRD